MPDPVAPAAAGDRGPRSLRHRPALDGLRALAVTAVLVYHLEPDLLPGGFLGVSLFFTLSGFLIANLLLIEWRHTGRIDLRRFWGRRFRRLLPAALAALVVVLAVMVASNDANLLEDLRGDVAGALAYVANWRFVANGDAYGAGYQEPSPVLHFWSLAIEEQFYLVVAVVALVLARVTRSHRVWAAVFGTLAVASMVATVVLYDPTDTARVYFGSDTRAFELLAGVLLAIGAGFAVPRLLHGRPWRHALGGFALTMVLAAFVFVGTDQTWLYRGGFWLMAGLSTVLIVTAMDDRSPLARALGWKPIAALGLISYGVYLYHWPLFAWLSPERTGLSGVPLAVVRLGATLALAVVSYHLLEQPIRTGRLRLRLAPTLAVTAGLVVVLLAGTTVLGDQSQTRAVAASAGVQLSTLGATPAAAEDAPVEVAPPARVLFIGDSLLHQSFPTIRDRLATQGIDSRAIGAPGQHLMTGDGAWIAALRDEIAAYEPDLVVLEACCGWGLPFSRERYLDADGSVLEPDTPRSWEVWRERAEALTAVATEGGRPAAWILAPPAQTNGYYGPIEGRIGLVNEFYGQLASCMPGVGTLDWRGLANPDGTFAWDLPDAGGRLVRVRTEDGLHLTPPGQAAVADLTTDAVLALWRAHHAGLDTSPSPTCTTT